MKNFFYVSLVGLSTVIGWIINYAYHPLMIRYLTITQFAEFESLVGIFNILWVLTAGISLFLVKEIAKNAKNGAYVKSLFLFSNRILLVLWCFVYVVFAAFSPFIAHFLRLNSVFPVLLTGMIIPFSFQGTVVSSVLQGLQKFSFISFTSILASVCRLAFGGMFVWAWYALFGAIGWFIASGAILLGINLVFVWRLLQSYPTVNANESMKRDFKKDFYPLFHFFLLTFLLAVFTNMDVIVVKNLYNADIAGLYSGISVVAKFLIFLGSAIETVYYPQIMQHKKESPPKHFLFNAFAFLLLLMFFALTCNMVFGGWILNTLKPWLWAYKNLFLYNLMFCGLFTFVSFYSKVLIGWKVYAVNYILCGLLVALVSLLYFLPHISVTIFVLLFIAFSLIAALCCGLFIHKIYTRPS